MLNLNVAVDPDEFVDSLVRTRDDNAIFEIIVMIDDLMVDWDFTERLYKHFKQQHKDYKEEKKYLKELYR
jgi:hypothetical protein